MTYTVKEIFYTLQGEGANAGRAAVFCRFSGCNLWSGREEDRSRAVCQFCDTDFVGMGADGGRFKSPELLAEAVATAWRGDDGASDSRLVVCTGGEPMLQLDQPLIDAIHARGFVLAVETNGTRKVPDSVDWICVSPKAGAPLVQLTGDELKLVFPQPAAMPVMFENLDFRNFFLQPMDGPSAAENSRIAVKYCMMHPQWRLSIQTHKLLNVR